MPKKTQTEDWVEAIRIFLRDQLGNENWQIRKGEREKVRLGIRFESGKRTYKYFPYKWQRTNAREIQFFLRQFITYIYPKNLYFKELKLKP